MEQILISTFIEEYEGGIEQLEKARYKNAIILLSKSLFALSDLLLFIKLNRTPKNHTERFRLLEEYYPDIYNVVDDAFRNYTDSYTKPITKSTCEAIKYAVGQVSKNPGTPEKIKRCIEKV